MTRSSSWCFIIYSTDYSFLFIELLLLFLFLAPILLSLYHDLVSPSHSLTSPITYTLTIHSFRCLCTPSHTFSSTLFFFLRRCGSPYRFPSSLFIEHQHFCELLPPSVLILRGQELLREITEQLPAPWVGSSQSTAYRKSKELKINAIRPFLLFSCFHVKK
jgi:hypothetical protein